MSSFVPYPDVRKTDDTFNKVIAAKKEFATHIDRVLESSCVNDSGTFELTPSQKIVKSYISPFTPYNGILLFHGTGTGKTCSAISLAEQFNDMFSKKHLVLVKTSLKDNFRKQIFDVSSIKDPTPDRLMDLDRIPTCSGSRYVTPIADRKNLTKEALESRVNRLINERWQLMGYGEFYSAYQKVSMAIAKISKDDDMKARRLDKALSDIFSDRVIIIDEAHNLRIAGEATKKRVPPKLEHVLRVSKNVKLVLLTATPMYNLASEIVYLISLLLLNDKRISLPLRAADFTGTQSNELTEEGISKLRDYMQGYVSYVSANDPKTFPVRLFPDINKDPNILQLADMPTHDILKNRLQKTDHSLLARKLVKSYFGEYQKNVYDLVRATILKPSNSSSNSNSNSNSRSNDLHMDDVVSSKAIVAALEISNVALPGSKHQFGEEGFNSCFTKAFTPKGVSQVTSWTYKDAVVKEKGEFLSYDLLQAYAPKLKSIVDYILNSVGIVYVYTTFVYNGAIPLAMALEHVGFTKYGQNNLLNNIKVANKVRNKSYVILSANDEVSKNNAREIIAARSKNNTDGSVIKVIIGTSVASEGIDFKAIREVHIMEPWYNFNKLEQVFGRAIRHCSHSNLPLEERNVTIFQHVNILRKGTDKRCEESVDLRVYRIANEKQTSISHIERLMRESSIDCLLTKPKPAVIFKAMRTSQNKIIQTYELESQAISCSSKLSSTTEDSTFHRHFIEDDIALTKDKIKQLFAKKHYMDFIAIAKGVAMKKEVVLYALNDMIENQDRVVDGKGNIGIIDYKSDKYIFQPVGHQFSRLLLEQRRPDQWRDVAVGRTKIRIQPRISAPLHTKTATQPKNAENEVVKSILEDVNGHVKALTSRFPLPSEMTMYEQEVVDYVFDRLTAEHQMELVMAKAALPSNVATSIETSHKVYVDQGITYFVDVDSTSAQYFFKKDGGVFAKCGVIEEGVVKPIELMMRDKIKADLGLKKLQDALAFVAPTLLKERMKIIRRGLANSTGSVCAQTSDIKKDDMINNIRAVEGANHTIPAVVRVTKVDLCNLYEIVLRKHSPSKFLRPYDAYLISRKN